MRTLFQSEFSCVVGGEELQKVIIPGKRQTNDVVVTGIKYANPGQNSVRSGVKIGGGGSPVLTTVKQVCTDEQTQVCEPRGMTKTTFGLSGVTMEQKPGGCTTKVTTRCVTEKATR